MDKWVLRKPARAIPRGRVEVARLLDRGPPSARIVAVVGHELRAPLAAALLYMKIAERHLYPDVTGTPARTALATARQEIMRVERLVGRVIELQRLGHPVLHSAWVDLGEVVRETVHRNLLGDVSAQVTLEAGPGALAGWWDEGAVEQIVQNLLSNALKFGAGRPILVTVGPAPGGGARISVRDQGVGISAADRERIFKRSVRSPADKSGGLGLGLWLVRQLAEAHGGKVIVRSRVRKGSTFTVTLRPLMPLWTERRGPAAITAGATRLPSALEAVPEKTAEAV
jgi:signal transduction histidine kinase